MKGRDMAMLPAMNNTKWNEIRLEMDAIEPVTRWSTLSTSGYQSEPDCDWFYHFRIGGYEDIVHLDIFAENPDHREVIRSALRKIHVPGVETAEGFRVFGYLTSGQVVDYI